MTDFYRRPVITLSGGGDAVTLDGVGRGYTLKPGSTGLGVAPVEITRAELPTGGAVVRHRRRTVREVFLPIDVHFGTGTSEYADLEDARRRLERICAGEVLIRVEGKDGGRSTVGFLTDGLGGDFATSSVNLLRMNLGLTFECQDPWWYGDQQEVPWALEGDRRPVLSRLWDRPSTPQLARSNYMLNPAFDSDVGWVDSQDPDWVDASVSSEQTLYGTPVRRLETLVARTSMIGGAGATSQNAIFDTAASEYRRYRAAVWVWAGTGVGRVAVSIQSDASGGWQSTATTTLENPMLGSPVIPRRQFFQVIVEEQSAIAGRRRIQVNLSRGGLSTGVNAVPVGTVSYIGAAVLTDAQSPVDYWDGDSTVPGYTASWDGDPYASISRLHTIPAGPDDMMAIPFGSMMLSASTVQGARRITVQGDAPAEAVIIVEGPGEELLIVNETTQQLVRIEHQITEPITIDARPRRRDIYSKSWSDGQWWEYVSKDTSPSLISLQPGENRLRVVMVGAKPQSRVRLLYRPTFMAAH